MSRPTVREITRVIQRFNVTPAGARALEGDATGDGLRVPVRVRAHLAAAVEVLSECLENDTEPAPAIRAAREELSLIASPPRELEPILRDLEQLGVGYVIDARDLPRVIRLLMELEERRWSTP